MDKFRSIINRLSGGGTPAIQKVLEQHHAQVMADATRHSQVAKMYYSAAINRKDPTTGQKVNPATGQPWTDEDVAKWKGQADAAMADYGKIVGKAKAAKPILQQVTGLIKHATGHIGGGGGQQQGQAKQGQQTVAQPPQGATPASQEGKVAPPPGAGGMNPLEESAMLESSAANTKDERARSLKDEEYRDKLTADADPRYHVNEINTFRDDLKEAFPQMAPEDVEKAVLTKAGVVPKGAGKEMQPDFKDGMLVGVKDPATNSYYTDPEKMPPEAKAIYDSAKKVEKDHEAATEAKEQRQLRRSLAIQSQAFNNAIASSDHKEAHKEFLKAKGNYNDAIDRQKTMDQNLQDIAEAQARGEANQQAMLSMVANHIGMTSGAQPRMRMSKAQWDEAVQSTPYLDRVEAHFDDKGYLKGVVLTNEQANQMVQLAHEKVGILNDHVERMRSDPDYADDSRVDPRAKVSKPPDGKSKRIKVTAEDMK